ncbi:MAG: hypothetical protein VKI83_04190 [Synechococcaceae cyanobacterium]|nr:hypothetical protein [Synechococcaceae cyanobacterium]
MRTQPWTDPPQPLRSLLASLLGIAAGLGLTRFLPVVPSTLLNALILAGGARLSASCHHPSRWWGLIGCLSGSLIGNGWVLAKALHETHPADHAAGRITLVGLIALAGMLAGESLARSPQAGSRRRPADLLRSASGLTAGIFAVLVTLTFLHLGLDGARAFSSRLSTSLTILVATLAAPGWLMHLIRQQLQASAPLAGRLPPRSRRAGGEHR